MTPARAQESPFEVTEATIDEIHAAFASGELSCVELVEGYLARIAAYDQVGPALNAVRVVNSAALDEAAALDAAYAEAGPAGPLHCIPVLVKDQVETADMPTTNGSVIFEGYVSGRDATVVTRMKDDGAIIVAKTNMGEYASRYNGSIHGIIRNAYDPTRNPSGSSGGTGAGVAASFGTVGIAEDTGGSTRGPAAVHSLVGLRGTHGLISTFGMMPASPTRDTLGPVARTVKDAAILTDTIAGYDSNDPMTAPTDGNVPDTYTAALDAGALQGARIGVIRQPMDDSTEPDSEDYAKVKAVVDEALGDMEGLGATVVDAVEVPGLVELLDATGSNAETEAAVDAYLAGLPNEPPVATFREIAVSDLVTPTRRGSLISALNRSTDSDEHLASLAARAELRRVVERVMADNDFDALLYATFDHQTTVIPDDVLTNADTEDDYGKGSNRTLSPATGLPALTFPAGFTTDELPVGIELLGRAFDESILFGLAYAYEQGTMRREPPATTPPLH